ncbi:MAG TPA: hypothetical protein VNI78_01455 [Vicinamibacterales bacterium]|nr:hypothetical protein [Vicinamibacterales bacterium]
MAARRLSEASAETERVIPRRDTLRLVGAVLGEWLRVMPAVGVTGG